MLRTSVFRVARAAARPSIARIAVTPAHAYNRFIRFESTKAEQPEQPPQIDTVKEAWRKARDLKDKLNHNWDAVTLTYEQVKPKTLSPSPVRALLFLPFFLYIMEPNSIANGVTAVRQDAYLIDVREPDEVIQGSIPSSVNLPLSVLSNSLHLHKDAFMEKHGFDKPRLTEEIVFYCRSGKRSATACDIAKRNGYTKCVVCCFYFDRKLMVFYP